MFLKYIKRLLDYIIDPQKIYNEVEFKDNEYSSKNHVMTKNEVCSILSRKDFYQ